MHHPRLAGLLAITLIAVLWTTAACAEEVQLEHDGLTLNANLATAGEDWQDGPVVLMTHGTLAHGGMEIMSTLQQVFRDRGISSLALTLSLGQDDRHGMYDCASPHRHAHTDALDEIGWWLRWLEGQGVDQVALLGHSRGGNQTAWFAAERAAPAVGKVILIAPQTWSKADAAQDYQKRFDQPLAPVLAEARRLVAEGQGDTLLEDTGFIYCEDAMVSAQSFVAYYDPDPRRDTATLLAAIEQPVLVIVGTADTVVADLETVLAPLAEEGTIRLEVIEGADHMFRDLYAEDIADIVAEFLAE